MYKLEIPLHELGKYVDSLVSGDCVYYWISGGHHLYIGQSSNVLGRIKSHIDNFERFIYEADTLIVEYPFGVNKYGGMVINESKPITSCHHSKHAIVDHEYIAIKTHKPKYNINATENKISEQERRFIVGQRVKVREFYNKLSASLCKPQRPIFDSNVQEVEKPKQPIRKEVSTKSKYFHCKREARIYQITNNWDIKEWISFRKKYSHDSTYTNSPIENKWDGHRRMLLSSLESYVSVD